MITTQSRVFVDGALIGLVDDPKALVQKIRVMRRQGAISHEINCSHKEFNGDIIIHTDRGRARRPLIILQDGKPLIPEEDLQKLKNKEIEFGDIVKKGYIEFIDAEEEEDLLIAINIEDITPAHTHLEIDPSLILGIGAAHVPFPEHNASPRVTMGAGMVKQALGFADANMKLRPDTRGHMLHYVQKPMVYTQTSEGIGSDDRAAGQNFVVAILSYQGFNIEDALIFNKGSIDRGLGRSHFFRTYEGEERRYPGGQIDRIEVPDEDVTGAHGTDYYTNSPEMNLDQLKTLVFQGMEIGVSFMVLAGGEPLIRKDEILTLSSEFPDMIFAVFTNGIFINEETAAAFSMRRNLVPIISIEGSEKETD